MPKVFEPVRHPDTQHGGEGEKEVIVDTDQLLTKESSGHFLFCTNCSKNEPCDCGKNTNHEGVCRRCSIQNKVKSVLSQPPEDEGEHLATCKKCGKVEQCSGKCNYKSAHSNECSSCKNTNDHEDKGPLFL